MSLSGLKQCLVGSNTRARFTGRALSDWQSAAASPVLSDWRGVVLEPLRETLYARCDARLATMDEQGALAEVERLLARRLDPALPVMKALGVPEFAAHLSYLSAAYDGDDLQGYTYAARARSSRVSAKRAPAADGSSTSPRRPR